MSQQSFLQQPATGADINFTITTFSSDEIQVYVDGVKKTAGVHYNINPYNSSGQSTVDWIGTAPTSPSVIRVIRQTDVMNNGNTAVEGRATFQAGSSVKADDLNNNTKQVLRAIQELQDQKIQGYDLEDNSITTAQIANNAITTTNIADDAVTTAKLANSIVSDITANNAKVTNVTTNLTTSTSSTSVTVNSSDGTNATIGEATSSAAGVMSTAHHDKLDGIEAGATADQTNAEIRAAVEAASNSNVFTDADHSKLNGIETAATADQTAAEIRTLVESASDSNVFTDADHSKLNAIEAGATADQTNAEIRAAVEAATDSNVFTDADHSKLNGIETGATGDQTASEIRTLVGSASDSNVFTDADHSKLDTIETGATADQTASDISALGFSTLTGSETLTNKTLTTPVINDFSGTAIVTSGTSTSDNKVYSAKRSDELYSTGASQAAASATAAASSATAASSSQSAAATSAATASTQATNAAASATTATTQATTATTQAAAALSNLNEFKGVYLGDLASNPSSDALGNVVNEGDLYFNTTAKQLRVYNGSAWAGLIESALELTKLATSDFSAVYTASAGSNSIDLGGLAITGAAFSNEQIAANRMSLAKGSATYNLGGI